MFEVEIYARGLREMGKIVERNRRLVEIAGLRYKVDTNHDVVYVEFDEPTLSVREIAAIFPNLGLKRLFIGAIISNLAKTATITTPPFNNDDGTNGTSEARETIARALAEVVQTRTWGLLIDLVAQTGHYKPNATGLADFIVEGEKRYWLHIAIDRFDGTIVGQQLEEVIE